MPTQNNSSRFGGYDDSRAARPASRTEPGISRDRAPSGTSRTASGARRTTSSAPRTATGARPTTGNRTASASRSNGARSGGSRTTSGGRRPSGNRRKKKVQGRFYAFVAVLAVIVVALVLIIAKPFSGRDREAFNTPQNTATVVQNNGDDGGNDIAAMNYATQEPATQFDNIAAMLASEDTQVQGLSAADMAQVSDLSVNTSLPEEWMNILLLGTDERTLSESARTDAMMICSINRNTGEVKLTSIMRDLAINYTDIGKYNGTYRINAANFFGGPRLAIKTVNEAFNMNIQTYVIVNFFGFTKIAERLGGVEVDVSQAEMEEINYRIWEQYKLAREEGIDESGLDNSALGTYGSNVHLNGRQTLAYARLRHFDGGDSIRTERQRIVLSKLLEKAKKLNALEIVSLGTELFSEVQTNMSFEDMIAIATKVGGNGITNMKTFRLPVVGTYKEERRNDQDMLYDCDFRTNQIQLYNFIYT